MKIQLEFDHDVKCDSLTSFSFFLFFFLFVKYSSKSTYLEHVLDKPSACI